jgi:hypothetical protein
MLVPVVLAAAATLTQIQSTSAAVPAVEGRAEKAPIACRADVLAPQVYHMDKIVFDIAPEPKLTARQAADQVHLDALPRITPLDIKVLDNPRAIADLKGKVLSFIGAADTPTNRQAIIIREVLYATAVCYPKGW